MNESGSNVALPFRYGGSARESALLRAPNAIVFAVIVWLMALSHASANAVILIDIKTTPAAVTYSINNEPMTPTELAKWMTSAIEAFGDEEPILVQPDSQTTFATVFALLESLKASGVKHFKIIAQRSNSPAGFTKRYLTTNAQDLRHEVIPAFPPIP